MPLSAGLQFDHHPDERFMAAAVAAAPTWLPSSTPTAITQALLACVKLQEQDTDFMLQVLQRSQQLLSQKPGNRSRQQQADANSIAGVRGLTVAQFDMQQLAGAARGGD